MYRRQFFFARSHEKHICQRTQTTTKHSGRRGHFRPKSREKKNERRWFSPCSGCHARSCCRLRDRSCKHGPTEKKSQASSTMEQSKKAALSERKKRIQMQRSVHLEEIMVYISPRAHAAYYLPVCNAMLDVYLRSTDLTQQPCARSHRSYWSHRITRAIDPYRSSP